MERKYSMYTYILWLLLYALDVSWLSIPITFPSPYSAVVPVNLVKRFICQIIWEYRTRCITHTYNPTFVTYCVFVYQLIVYAMGKWNTFVFNIDNTGDFFLSPSNNLLNVPSINPDVWLINMRNATIAHRMPLVRVQPFNQIPHENIMYVRPVS